MRDEIIKALANGPLKTFALRRVLGISAGEAARTLSAEMARMRRAGLVDLVADRTWGIVTTVETLSTTASTMTGGGNRDDNR